MAHTDAHDPIRVRMLDPHRHRAIHDHSTGPCDLLPLHEWVKDVPSWRAVRCRWDLTLAEYYERPVCGCYMCTAQGDRKRARRKERHQSHSAIDAGMSDWLDELDEARAEQEEADYEAGVQAQWAEIHSAVERRNAVEELALQREAQLRDYMESVEGVTPRTFL